MLIINQHMDNLKILIIFLILVVSLLLFFKFYFEDMNVYHKKYIDFLKDFYYFLFHIPYFKFFFFFKKNSNLQFISLLFNYKDFKICDYFRKNRFIFIISNDNFRNYRFYYNTFNTFVSKSISIFNTLIPSLDSVVIRLFGIILIFLVMNIILFLKFNNNIVNNIYDFTILLLNLELKFSFLNPFLEKKILIISNIYENTIKNFNNTKLNFNFVLLKFFIIFSIIIINIIHVFNVLYIYIKFTLKLLKK